MIPVKMFGITISHDFVSSVWGSWVDVSHGLRAPKPRPPEKLSPGEVSQNVIILPKRRKEHLHEQPPEEHEGVFPPPLESVGQEKTAFSLSLVSA